VTQAKDVLIRFSGAQITGTAAFLSEMDQVGEIHYSAMA
jgi:hypothetical protein